MAQIPVRQTDMFGKHLQHAALGQVRVRIPEPPIQDHEVLMAYLRIIYRHLFFSCGRRSQVRCQWRIDTRGANAIVR
jgi:hypothetical protein